MIKRQKDVFPQRHRKAVSTPAREKKLKHKLLIETKKAKSLERAICKMSTQVQKQIGKDLHDTVCQDLMAASYMVAEITERLKQVMAIVQDAGALTRDIARGLSVDVGPDLLPKILSNLMSKTADRFRSNCKFRLGSDVKVADDAVACNLYFIAKEATQNAITHGKAKNIRIRFGHFKNGGYLVIKNDGLRFQEDRSKTNGIGLNMMNHRAHSSKGSLTVRAGARNGTVVGCFFKLR